MEKLFGTISRLLSGHMLGHAFTLLRPWVVEALKNGAPVSLSDRLQSLEKNYRYVVDYFMSHEDDPNREEVTEELVREAYILLDDVYLEKRLQESTSYEFHQMLQFFSQPVGPRVASEDDIDGPPQVFRFFWLCKSLEEFDLNVLDEYIHNPQMEEEAELGISGLTLNLLRHFSEEGMQFMVMVCGGHHTMPIMERAWVSLILLMLHYDVRMRYFPSVMNAFLDLIATDEGSAFAQHALSALARTTGVEWASASFRGIQDQLLQFIGKNMPSKLTKDRIVSLSMADLDDFNSALSDQLKSVLEERGRKLMDLKSHNLDSSFALYKDLYTTPFFSDPFHWWLPYDTDYLNDKLLKVAAKLEDSFPDDTCDSDRYALISGFSSFEGELPEGFMVEPPREDQPVPVCNNYMKQAYRFFALNPWGIPNVFQDIDIITVSNLLKLLRPGARDKMRLGDLFLECHAYSLAYQMYSQITPHLPDEPELWAHYGFCSQKLGLTRTAIEAYNSALQLVESEWVLRQKVWCQMHKDVQDYDRALETLDKLLTIKPKDSGYLYTKGRCLANLELYAEALDVFCELEVMHPGDIQVMRHIAWCAFVSGDDKQSYAYHQKVMASEDRSRIDYLNYGHYLFVQGERGEAFRNYKQSLVLFDSLKEFLQQFRPDRRYLLERGIPTSDIYLMEDQLISVKD